MRSRFVGERVVKEWGGCGCRRHCRRRRHRRRRRRWHRRRRSAQVQGRRAGAGIGSQRARERTRRRSLRRPTRPVSATNPSALQPLTRPVCLPVCLCRRTAQQPVGGLDGGQLGVLGESQHRGRCHTCCVFAHCLIYCFRAHLSHTSLSIQYFGRPRRRLASRRPISRRFDLGARHVGRRELASA